MKDKIWQFAILLYLCSISAYANRYESDATGEGYGGGGGSLGTLILWLIGAAIAIYIYIRAYKLFSVGSIEPDLFEGDSLVFPIAIKLGLIAILSFPIMFVVASWFGKGGYVAVVSPAISAFVLGAFDAKRYEASDIQRLNQRNEVSKK